MLSKHRLLGNCFSTIYVDGLFVLGKGVLMESATDLSYIWRQGVGLMYKNEGIYKCIHCSYLAKQQVMSLDTRRASPRIV